MKKYARVVGGGVVLALSACSGDSEDWRTLEHEVVQTGVTYTIVGVHSGKCVQMPNANPGADVNIATCVTNNTQQQWRFESMASGWYRIRNVATGRCMDVESWSTANGARIMQWDCTSGNNQQFRANDRGNTVHELINRHSNLAMDVNARGTADGTRLIQWPLTGGTNQHFRLVPVSGGGGGTGGSSGDSGGSSGSGGGTAGTAGSGGGSTAFPCNGSTSGYDAVVSISGATWTARRGSSTVYTGGDMRAAIQAGVDSLTANRTTKQRVLVQGSGTIAANSRVSLPSYTILNVCGTINVTGTGSGDMAPLYARGRRDIEIPNVSITGSPVYGMFFRDVDNLTLGNVDMRVTSGLGIRVDNHGRSDRSQKVRNLRIDNVYVQGTRAHGVETYGVDGVTIGTVTARNVGESGLLFNDTVNATVVSVDAEGAGAGTGYAAFRMANRNGRIGSSYPTNIRVGSVRARGGGRGIFCVSESGGAVIDRVDIAQTGSNSILLENCYNVTIANQSGSVNGSDIRIASRSEFAVSSGITIQNLALTNTVVNESPCGTNIIVRNNTLNNSRYSVCSGTAR